MANQVTVTVTVTRALARAKIIKDLLEDLKKECFVGYVRSSEKNGELAQQYQRNSQANIDEYKSLVKEYVAIKTAIHQFNDTKTVTVLGLPEMTVAAILVEKTILQDRRDILNTVRDQYSDALHQQQRANAGIDSEVSAYLANQEKQFGDTAGSKEAIEQLVKTYREAKEKERSLDIVSGFNHAEFIEKESEFINSFMNEIDTILSEINATNTISYSY
nr:MAG TPA: hypothetical protein [Caudoviricetes sp.]